MNSPSDPVSLAVRHLSVRRATTTRLRSFSRATPSLLHPYNCTAPPGLGGTGWHQGGDRQTYDIFEGTEQIQQLVIARAISGMRVE